MVTGEGSHRAGAIAQALARAGYDLVVQHHGSPLWARETARRVEARGRRALVVQTALSDPAGLASAVDEVRSAYARLDVLVNGATRWEDHFLGPLLAVRAAAPLLNASGGCVVNILAGHASDADSRAGLERLTRGMARILAPRVRVNAVALPGREGGPHAAGAAPTADVGEAAPGGDVELARAVLFLLGSPHFNGEVLSAERGSARR